MAYTAPGSGTGASSSTCSSANASSSAVASAPVASSSRTVVPGGKATTWRPRTSPARGASNPGAANVASFMERAYPRRTPAGLAWVRSRRRRPRRGPAGVALRVGLVAGAAVLRAEVLHAAQRVGAQRLEPVDLHAADRVGRAAPHGEPEQRGEDDDPQDIEEQLVVEPDAAEHVAP